MTRNKKADLVFKVFADNANLISREERTTQLSSSLQDSKGKDFLQSIFELFLDCFGTDSLFSGVI